MKKYLILILVFLGLFCYTASDVDSWDARRSMRPKFSIPMETCTRPNIDFEGELGEGTFTRNSLVNFWNTSGVMESAVTDIPVYECVGLSGTTPAYNCTDCELAGLREPASTNSILFSRDVTNAAGWTKTCAATRNQTGIFGDVNSGVSCSDVDGAAADGAWQNIVVADDNNTHVSYWHIKKDTNEARFPRLDVALYNGVTKTSYVWFNTKTGLATQEAGATDGDFGVVDCEDWWLVWQNITNDSSGNTQLRKRIYPARGTVYGTTANAATGTIVVDGIQVELNTKVPSSFITTYSTAVTRATTSGYPQYTLPTSMYSDKGTVTMWVNPGYAYGDISAGDYGLVSTDGNAKSLLYFDENGNICTFDGTNETTHNVNWPTGEWRKYFASWDKDLNKVWVGYDSGSGVTKTEGTFDGAYAEGANLGICVGLAGPMHTKRFATFDRVLTNIEHNQMGSPSN